MTPHRLTGVNAYRPEQRSFAVGDRIQFTSAIPNRKSLIVSSAK